MFSSFWGGHLQLEVTSACKKRLHNNEKRLYNDIIVVPSKKWHEKNTQYSKNDNISKSGKNSYFTKVIVRQNDQFRAELQSAKKKKKTNISKNYDSRTVL